MIISLKNECLVCLHFPTVGLIKVPYSILVYHTLFIIHKIKFLSVQAPVQQLVNLQFPAWLGAPL